VDHLDVEPLDGSPIAEQWRTYPTPVEQRVATLVAPTDFGEPEVLL